MWSKCGQVAKSLWTRNAAYALAIRILFATQRHTQHRYQRALAKATGPAEISNPHFSNPCQQPHQALWYFCRLVENYCSSTSTAGMGAIKGPVLGIIASGTSYEGKVTEGGY